jgi:type IV pilus assembly protein PilM
MSVLDSFLGKGSCLGIDIGTTSIKIAEILKGKKKPALLNYGVLETYGHLDRVNDAIQTSSLKIAEQETARLLKLLVGKLGVKSKEVIASMPAFSSFISLLKTPEMSDAETVKAMSFQIRQRIPLPVSEVAIDWLRGAKRRDESGNVTQEILLISIPNEYIKRYQSIFKLAGLDLVAIELESLGLVRALVENDPTPTLIADIGARATNIVVVENGLIKHGIQSDFAGSSLTQAVANGLNINIRRAEELKRKRGISSAGSEYELSTLTLPFLDAIINEVRRARDFYEKDSSSKIERIILAGGGANLSGIDKYVQEQMNMPVIIGNPFLNLEYPAKIEPLVKELGPALSVAIGLGMKGIG